MVYMIITFTKSDLDSYERYTKLNVYGCGGGSFLYCHFTGTAHCANMYPPASTDPPQLQKARMTIRAFLFEWLTQNDYIVSDDNIQFF